MAVSPAVALGNNNGTSLTSLQFTVAASVPADDHVVVDAGWGASGPTPTVTDSQGNVYTERVARVSADLATSLRIFEAKITTPLVSGVDWIRISFTGSVNNAVIAGYHYAGVAKVSEYDTSASATGNSNSPSSGSITTSQNDEVVHGATYYTSTSAFTPGAGWTELQEITVNSIRKLETQERILAATGSHAASGSITSTVWLAAILGLKAAVGSPPAFTADPVVSGTPEVGETLTVTPGTTTGSPSLLEYQWERDGQGDLSYVPISGETALTYEVDPLDVACNVRCVESATNSAGTTSANSNAVGPAYSPLDTPSSLVVGQVISIPPGGGVSWDDVPTSFEYKWMRSLLGLTVWPDISGQTDSHYDTAEAEIGYYVRGAVRGVNAAGNSPWYYTSVAGPVVGTPVPPALFDPPVVTLAAYSAAASFAAHAAGESLATHAVSPSLASYDVPELVLS